MIEKICKGSKGRFISIRNLSPIATFVTQKCQTLYTKDDKNRINRIRCGIDLTNALHNRQKRN